ncbi:MAG: lipopolysaccharide heptosyltransferase I [Rhodobiaceae bacterium]|nr:lipopolysaccharide heptosyltransferase I [Rhodobiaceae bacterium]MCC0017886.1 lipopolysaccharide heptosyltransferase I [Rhodobiaceae bacterium]MCC0051536.1 lipopolysaccharide heptosyltransferase I [Rhodobiaceae bacterium]MCC0062161.1 lipopolysaccharide heptosyltransferase I [Rhodobiaceae bacterium]
MSFRVLLVRFSSLGDVVHTYPALSDLKRARPDVEIDWLASEAHLGLAGLHPAVRKAIPAHLEAMKKKRLSDKVTYARVLREVLKGKYDLVIDTEGTLKSAAISRLAGAPVAGYGREHVSEPWASFAYRYRFDLPVTQHVAVRTRKLFAEALGYGIENLPLDNGLDARTLTIQGRTILAKLRVNRPPVVILHGSTWSTKTWAPERWRAVARLLETRGIPLVIPAGGAAELDAAVSISNDIETARVLPPLSMVELAGVIAAARAVAGVDSGLTHLAGALGKPGVILIGPADPVRSGPLGKTLRTIVSSHPDAPCFRSTCTLTPGGRCCMDGVGERDVVRAIEYALAMA